MQRVDLLAALTRMIALDVAGGDTQKAKEYLDWAYHDLPKVKKPDVMILGGEQYLVPGTATRKMKDAFIKEYIVGGKPFPVEDARQKIKDMEYSDFVKTPYWKSIATYVKVKAGRQCEKCGNIRTLHVHHTTYENHGDELHHLDDLVCLCEDCHNKTHYKE